MKSTHSNGSGMADLVRTPGPGGLAVLGTVDPDAALAWARDRLAGEREAG